MNYDAHPGLVLPEGYNRVSVLEGIGGIIQGSQFLLDGWLFENTVYNLDELDRILGVHHLSNVPAHMAMIIPDEKRSQTGFWQPFQVRGFGIFPDATPERSGMRLEQAYNHFDLRRSLFLSAAKVLQSGQM